MQAEALAAAKQYEKDAVDRIRRISIISADLEVKGNKKNRPDPKDGPAPWSRGPDDMANYSSNRFMAS